MNTILDLKNDRKLFQDTVDQGQYGRKKVEPTHFNKRLSHCRTYEKSKRPPWY